MSNATSKLTEWLVPSGKYIKNKTILNKKRISPSIYKIIPIYINLSFNAIFVRLLTRNIYFQFYQHILFSFILKW